MTQIDNQYYRILHEYEIADKTNQHFASIVYIREFNKNNAISSLCDDVDAMMEAMITAKCNVRNRHLPKLVVMLEEVQELDKRLREEYQLKAYFTFYSETGDGKNMEYSRVTIHTTILVKNEMDVPYFNNLGFAQQVAYPAVEAFTIYYHAPSPVYTLQEHPLVHGIVCYKEATNSNILYFLYRHNNNPEESILATVDLVENKTVFLIGTDSDEKDVILSLSQAFISQNNYAPLYKYRYEKSAIGYCVPTRIVLNRELENFTRAKNIVMKELQKIDNQIYYAKKMISYLKMMVEA